MSNFVTGYSHPKFVIIDSALNIHIDTIDLDLTNESGFTEIMSPTNDVVHYMITGEKRVKSFGFRARFTLDYSGCLSKLNALKIEKIWDYWLQEDINGDKKNQIILYPRADILSRFYEVVYSGEPVQINISAGEKKFNKNFIWEWHSRYLVQWNWIDPDDIIIPLKGFALTS